MRCRSIPMHACGVASRSVVVRADATSPSTPFLILLARCHPPDSRRRCEDWGCEEDRGRQEDRQEVCVVSMPIFSPCLGVCPSSRPQGVSHRASAPPSSSFPVLLFTVLPSPHTIPCLSTPRTRLHPLSSNAIADPRSNDYMKVQLAKIKADDEKAGKKSNHQVSLLPTPSPHTPRNHLS